MDVNEKINVLAQWLLRYPEFDRIEIHYSQSIVATFFDERNLRQMPPGAGSPRRSVPELDDWSEAP